MSIAVLKDGTEVNLLRVNRFHQVDSKVITVTMVVPIERISLEESIAIFNKDNCKSITIKSEDEDDLVYKDYVVENIFESIENNEKAISIGLIKNVASFDSAALIDAYKARYEEQKRKEEEEKAAVEAAVEELSSGK